MTDMTRQIRLCECVFSRFETSELLCLALMFWFVGVFSHDFVVANVVVVLFSFYFIAVDNWSFTKLNCIPGY